MNIIILTLLVLAPVSLHVLVFHIRGPLQEMRYPFQWNWDLKFSINTNNTCTCIILQYKHLPYGLESECDLKVSSHIPGSSSPSTGATSSPSGFASSCGSASSLSPSESGLSPSSPFSPPSSGGGAGVVKNLKGQIFHNNTHYYHCMHINYKLNELAM